MLTKTPNQYEKWIYIISYGQSNGLAFSYSSLHIGSKQIWLSPQPMHLNPKNNVSQVCQINPNSQAIYDFKTITMVNGLLH